MDDGDARHISREGRAALEAELREPAVAGLGVAVTRKRDPGRLSST
jgi:hypothetical protein